MTPAELAAWAERASPDEQDEVLGALYELIHDVTPTTGGGEIQNIAGKQAFLAMLECGAFVDAALMLLPEGLVFNLMTDFGDLCRARVYGSVLPHQVPDRGWQADGATVALALLAAIARVMEPNTRP